MDKLNLTRMLKNFYNLIPDANYMVIYRLSMSGNRKIFLTVDLYQFDEKIWKIKK